MDIRKLQRAIVDGLEDVKAHDIIVLNTEHLSPLFERVIIASGTSNRQTKSLAASVRDAVRAKGLPVMRTEGEDNGEWIIVDCGAAVAHIMQPAIRQYYRLEEIWGGKAVRMKLGDDAPHGLVKASEPIDEAPAKKAPAKKAPAKKVAARKTAAGKAAPARKAAPVAAAKKTAAAKSAPAKKAPAKRPVARKAAAKPAARPR
jgi:ribosome-associated protein